MTLSDGVRRLFDGTNFAVLSTLEPDGRPHSTVVWTKRDRDDIVFALPNNRRKTANLNRDPRATVVVLVCPDDRAVGILESRALMMRRSSCRGGIRSRSVARCSI